MITRKQYILAKVMLAEMFKKNRTINELGQGIEPDVDSTDGDRRICTSYTTVTPESAENGDSADHGWEDEEGESMEPDKYDIEDGIDAVALAVKFLENHGGNEPSNSVWSRGTWYSTPDGDEDYSTGETTYRSFHLKGFSPEEEKAIYAQMKGKGR